MKNLILLCTFISCTFKGIHSFPEIPITYTAAVSEWKPFGIATNPRVTLETNVQTIEKVTFEAKAKKADIVILPEYSLFPHDIVFSRQELRKFLQEVLPREKQLGWNPCDEELGYPETEFLEYLSCTARAAKMYIVVNLGELERCTSLDPQCPKDGGFYYNCDVVFDREGNLIARYRKSNLYYEYPYDIPPRETIFFQTDFGVTFGLLTCFDIMWEQPFYDLLKNHSIKDFIVPSAWTDRMPFYLSPQIMQGNAIKHDINILQSEYYNPYWAGLGSGIFQGRSGVDVYRYSTETTYYLTITQVNTIKTQQKLSVTPLMPNFPAKRNYSSKHFVEYEKETEFTTGVSPIHRMKTLDMSSYKSLLLTSFEGIYSICDGSTCCEVEYKIRDSQLSSTYRLVVKAGMHNVGTAYAWYHQVCAVLRCVDSHDINSCNKHTLQTSNIESFEFLKLRGNFDDPDNVMPSVLKTDLSVTRKWHHQREDTNKVVLEVDSDERNIQVVLLYGRNFNK